ncbi:hypothetical protein AnigIFM63309_001537 [Aspergillus niger]|nr:hypothetical protein AnigIFM63309_001537 [Aspergillus niger]
MEGDGGSSSVTLHAFIPLFEYQSSFQGMMFWFSLNWTGTAYLRAGDASSRRHTGKVALCKELSAELAAYALMLAATFPRLYRQYFQIDVVSDSPNGKTCVPWRDKSLGLRGSNHGDDDHIILFPLIIFSCLKL